MATDSPQGRQNVVNAMRAVLQLPPASFELRDQDLVFHGDAPQAAMAEWLFHEVDRPAPAQSFIHEYRAPSASDDLIHVGGLGGNWTPQRLQEAINAVRSVIEVQIIVAVPGAQVIAFRGAGNRMTAADWLLEAISSPPAPRADFILSGLTIPREASNNIIHLVDVRTDAPPLRVQETVNAVRSDVGMQRIVAVQGRAIVMRGSGDQIHRANSLAERMLNEQ